MKIIKITTDNQVSIHEFPGGDIREQNKGLIKLIGDNCDLFEHVRPERLYTQLKAPQGTSMLIDEEGLIKELPTNAVATYLYGSVSGCIVGNVLIIGEREDEYGDMEFCGLSEKTLELLVPKFKEMAEVVENAK